MQISRHWRLNSQRYRLEGVRCSDGQVRLQARPSIKPDDEMRAPATLPTAKHVPVTLAS
jgi:hypothetical protein